MGAPASKIGQEIEEPAQGSLPSTPILTPKSRLIELDPRSPSDSIVRTPIEILLSKNKKHTPAEDNDSLSLEINSDTFNIYSPGVKLKNIDPRSPTLDFDRTPVVVPEEKVPMPIKLHNKNLDNVRKTLISSPLAKHTNKTSDKITSPKLLESNVISPRPIKNIRKSNIGLLETNLDFIETDLDTVKQNIQINKNTECSSSCLFKDKDENFETEIVNEPVQPTEVSEEHATPNEHQKMCLTSELDIISSENICVNDSVDLPMVKNEFIATPIRILQKLENLEIRDSSVKDIVHVTQIYTDYDDDGLRTTISRKPKSENTSKYNVVVKTDEQVNQTKAETVKNFDKKLSNLIYEDKEKSLCPVVNKNFKEYRRRTPLGIKNSNTNLSKRVPKLKVHDKPQKTGKELSRIPILLNKKGKQKFIQQCENTPPKNMEENKKGMKQQWDADNTLII